MEGFWTCSDCGSANLYPNIKECEVCGKQIDDYEIKQAEKHFREALKTQEQIKRNEEKEERLRKLKELEEKRKAEFEQKQKEKQKRLQEKIQKKEKNIKKCIDVERLFFKGFTKSLKILKNCIVCLLVLSIFVVGISVVRQESSEVIINEIENIVDSTILEFKESHYNISKKGNETFKPFKNIEKQYKYIAEHFEESENINNLMEILGW